MASIDANLAGVHPILDFRIRGLLSEPALRRYGTYPAVREYAKQKALHDRYKAGRGNLAADPDRVLRTGPAFPYAWTPRGSWHMRQEDGWGHAVDLRRPVGVTRAMADRAVKPYLARWGLKQTVRSEWWHLQALTSHGWVDGPTPSEHEGNETDMQLINDPENKRQFALWVYQGTTCVREYGKPRAGVGDDIPGCSIVIDEAIKSGKMVKA